MYKRVKELITAESRCRQMISIARTRVLAIFSSCRFSSYNTASGRFYQPGETFMTHLTYSGLCCFFLKY